MPFNTREYQKHLRNDILRLLSMYDQKSSFKFEDFVEIWNDMKFYQLLALNHFYPIHYRELITEAIKISCEYLCEELNLEVRAAALYILYGLYVNQNLKPRITIPVTPAHWLSILKFIDVITDRDSKDIEYVFRYLLYADAFDFSASIVGKALLNKANLNKIKENDNGVEDKIEVVGSNLDFELNLLQDETMEQMETIHEAYIQMKTEIGDDDHTGFVKKNLDVIVDDFKQLIKIEGLDEFGININDENSDNESAGETILERRKRIRQRAAIRGTQAEKKNQTESEYNTSASDDDDNLDLDDIETSDKPTTSKKTLKKSKIKRKTRRN